MQDIRPTSRTVTSRFLQPSKWCDALPGVAHPAHARPLSRGVRARAGRTQQLAAREYCMHTEALCHADKVHSLRLAPTELQLPLLPIISSMHPVQVCIIDVSARHAPLPPSNPTLRSAGHRHMHGRSDQHTGCVGACYRYECRRIMSTAISLPRRCSSWVPRLPWLLAAIACATKARHCCCLQATRTSSAMPAAGSPRTQFALWSSASACWARRR